MKESPVQIKLVERYIRGTEKEAIVQNVEALLCEITMATRSGISCSGKKVYIKTRVLKHCYDKRTAEEFDFLSWHIYKIVRFPDLVYKNKDPKRGDFLFVKTLKNTKYLCSLQEVITANGDCQFEIATFFRLNKEAYLTSYDLLWEWKDGTPSS